MNICANCFEDETLQYLINRFAGIKDEEVCPLCGHKGKLVSTDELDDIFSTMLDLFQPITTRDHTNIRFTLQDLCSNQWRIFSPSTNAASILSHYIHKNKSPFLHDDVITFSDEILAVEDEWTYFKKEILHKNRFFPFQDMSIDIQWEEHLSMTSTIPTDSTFYRARIHNIDETLEPCEMKAPPPHKASAGRGNPEGISYLYLSKDVETTLYETRSLFLDRVTIAKIKTNINLTIVDFTKDLKISIADDTLKALVKANLLRSVISEDLSKPLRRSDNVLNYVPTQFICEYVKNNVHADGILFKSSLHNGGINCILFDPNKVDVVEPLRIKEISRVTLDTEDVMPHNY